MHNIIQISEFFMHIHYVYFTLTITLKILVNKCAKHTVFIILNVRFYHIFQSTSYWNLL